MLPNFLSGFSAMIIFGLVTTMLTELLPSRTASAVALNSMGRNLFGCVGFAVAQPWLEACGNGWMFTAAAGVMLLSGFSVVGALRRWGGVGCGGRGLGRSWWGGGGSKMGMAEVVC